MRSVCTWSFLLCFVGLLLFFAHVTVGQGTRELFDPTLRTTQPRTTPQTPPLTPPFVPVPVPHMSSGREPATRVTPNPVLPTAPTVPGIPISDELRQLLTRELPTPADSEPPPSTSTSNIDIARHVISRLASVQEDVTEDEREVRELLFLRQQAEQIVDPERRETALARIAQTEIARQNRLERRARDEVGAELFYIPRLKEQYLNAGWCQLFDGHTDTGWKVQNSGHYAGGKFTFGQGEICSDPFHPGMVYTTIPFDDITLRFDYWAEKDSEVLLLIKTPPNPEDLNTSCYTFVLNSGRSSRPRGLLLGRHGHSLPQLRTMREQWDDPMNEEGTWHSIRVRIEESSVHVWLDRRGAITYFVPQPLAAGHIAFLVAKGQARFQNIIWQPKQTIAVFDTEGRSDLPWHYAEETGLIGDNASGFRLPGGTVESVDVFDNYVLQMQYYQGINSGRGSLFVRALLGQENTGYEISLQNFPRRLDRMSVVGADAGAFRLRKDARYVRAQDLQWTHLTVAVVDRQLATWVNGVQVCEIEDQRTVPWPQGTGPFLEPGTIRLSVPDNNTLFQFRRLTVSPVEL